MSRRGSDYRSTPKSFKSLFPTCQNVGAESARENCSPRTAFAELQRQIERELQNSERVLCAASNYKGNTSGNVCTAEANSTNSRAVCRCEERKIDTMKCFINERNDNDNVCKRRFEPEYISRPRLADSGILSAKKPSVRLALPEKAFQKNTPPRNKTRGSSAPVRCDSQSSKIRKPGSPTDVRQKQNQSLQNNKYARTGSPTDVRQKQNQSLQNNKYARTGSPTDVRQKQNQSLQNNKYARTGSPTDVREKQNQSLQNNKYTRPGSPTDVREKQNQSLQNNKYTRPGSPTDVREKQNQSLQNNKYLPTGSSPDQPPKNQNIENKGFSQSEGPIDNRLSENQNLKNKKYSQADNSPDNKQSENQTSKITKFSQSENQNLKSRKFPQSENQNVEMMRFSKSGVDDFNTTLNVGESQRLSLAGCSHHQRTSFHDQHQEKTSFHDHHHERRDEFPNVDEKSKESCLLNNFKSNEFPCEIDKDFDFLKACCPKAKEAKKNVKLPEMPCLDKENIRNLIKCESKDIEASWQMASSHKKTHKKPCPKQQKAQLSVKALVQASKGPIITCPPKYSPLEHPEPEDISPDVAAAMMFSQERGVKMEECPKDTIALLFPEESRTPFPEKGSFSVVDPDKSGQEDMIEKSAMVPSEGVSDSAYTRTMRRKGEDLTPQRSYDLDFAIGQSKREYVFVTEKPQRVNVVQFRGGSAPPWFPWYFSAFPDDDDGLKLVNSPSGLFYKAWLHSNPKNIPTNDVIVLD